MIAEIVLAFVSGCVFAVIVNLPLVMRELLILPL
jgi:hypothetical protein